MIEYLFKKQMCYIKNHNGQDRMVEISIIDKLAGHSQSGYVDSMENFEGISKVESIIRSIPGYYSNGPWKQLGGFFGAYLNQETYEIREDVPELSN
jgi:hypothetical protein